MRQYCHLRSLIKLHAPAIHSRGAMSAPIQKVTFIICKGNFHYLFWNFEGLEPTWPPSSAKGRGNSDQRLAPVPPPWFRGSLPSKLK